MIEETEVLVVGLGAMGSAALYHLAKDGVAPTGIEQFNVGHDRGSSHGHSRAFRSISHEPAYTRLVEASIPIWRDLEAESEERLLNLNGIAMFARDGNADLRTRIEVMEEVGSPYELLSSREVTDRFPGLVPPADTVTCFTPRAGFVDAGRCVSAHITQATRRGAIVYDKVPVTSIDLEGDRPEVVCENDRIRCERLVVTAGPWAAHLLADLDLSLRVRRQQKFYFSPKKPDLYHSERLPVYSDIDKQFYGFPLHGPGIKVADAGLGPDVSPDDVDRTLDVSTQEALSAWMHSILPEVDAIFVSGSTCMYTMTPDSDFLIGRHPHQPNVLVAAGFSGHGFKFSTLVGRILADLATTGETAYPIERFRLDRFATHASG